MNIKHGYNKYAKKGVGKNILLHMFYILNFM
jgi:hypothetical protein